MPAGAADLIEEVSEGKITGEEDRYSGTDLWDFAANVAGSKAAFDALAPAVKAKDADLVDKIKAGFTDIQAQLKAYADGTGYKPFSALTADDTTKMKTTLAAAVREPGHGGRRPRPEVTPACADVIGSLHGAE